MCRLFQKEVKVLIFHCYTILSKVSKLDCDQKKKKKVEAFDVHCVATASFHAGNQCFPLMWE